MGMMYTIFTDNSSSDLYTEHNVFDNSIYRILSMQNNMKTYMLHNKPRNEFDVFLVEGEKLTSSGIASSNFIALNEYLGSLGIIDIEN